MPARPGSSLPFRGRHRPTQLPRPVPCGPLTDGPEGFLGTASSDRPGSYSPARESGGCRARTTGARPGASPGLRSRRAGGHRQSDWSRTGLDPVGAGESAATAAGWRGGAPATAARRGPGRARRTRPTRIRNRVGRSVRDGPREKRARIASPVGPQFRHGSVPARRTAALRSAISTVARRRSALTGSTGLGDRGRRHIRGARFRGPPRAPGTSEPSPRCCAGRRRGRPLRATDSNLAVSITNWSRRIQHLDPRFAVGNPRS
jgi:hypothetical protein